MCIAVPGKVIDIRQYEALVDFGKIKKWVNIQLIEKLSINDYILVHAGYAVIKIDEKEAKESLAFFSSLIK